MNYFVPLVEFLRINYLKMELRYSNRDYCGISGDDYDKDFIS